ncbi:hypothetical protein EK21DRAFT_116503 [Setomelanomma holmii]|uniref:C2H2-type domain-containing protein n=1 Tax=Setomelanomma holmii TaxID=210430 RepID=A0A9P4GZJ1_9PLEO|nr:hypothetical protein EK21DRAFT_116503 [Setomelanomma holmii]
MWSARYRREESAEGFQLSPCLTASSGLLTPPSSYSIDARRNSVASNLSSLGPRTPVYGRNPFSEQSYVGVAGLDQCQNQSLEALSMEYSSKPSGPEGSSYDNWSTLGHSDALESALSMRLPDTFASRPSPFHSQMGHYSMMETPSSSASGSCTTSFSSAPYTDYSSHANDDAEHAATSEPMQSVWSYQYALAHMMAGPTIAPTEAVIGGEYSPVDTAEPDMDMAAYDDADVPPVPEPQEVVLKKEEPDTSEDERQFRRSIYISSTGGKSVKREKQVDAPKDRRRARNKTNARLHADNGRYELCVEGNIELVPGTKVWRSHGEGSNRQPHFCEMLTNGRPCGRKFRRQEHLHRHERTHSGRKDYICQIPCCRKEFNRNDNCWEHHWTHVHRPGKKDGRNKKCSLRRVLTFIDDPKHIEKLQNKWKKEVGYDYSPVSDPKVQEEEAAGDGPAFSNSVKVEEEQSPFQSVKKEERIRSKL